MNNRNRINQEVANRLDKMAGLTEKAKDLIAETDFYSLYDEFGRFETAEEINEYAEMMHEDEE